MDMKHTPGPWEQTERSERYTDETYTAITHITNRNVMGKHTEQDICHICTWGAECDEARANAAYIVTACNAYPELVAALEGLVSAVDKARHGTHGDTAQAIRFMHASGPAWIAARAALAKAQGGAQ